MTLPTHCSLTWESRPLFFQPIEKYPNDFLGFVIGQFWLPPTSGIDPRSVVLGVSNVYVSPSVEHAVVSISIVFKNDAMARQAQSYLESAIAARPGFTVARNERLVSLFAPHPP
jgi:hypothetical protein